MLFAKERVPEMRYRPLVICPIFHTPGKPISVGLLTVQKRRLPLYLVALSHLVILGHMPPGRYGVATP